MATYMTQFSYTPEAWASLAKNPEDRGKAFASLAEKLGGKMHNFYRQSRTTISINTHKLNEGILCLGGKPLNLYKQHK